jgi:leucyl/phenylalanyl-tRNA--protein transferase
MYKLTSDIIFPHPKFADEKGLLAFGGDLSLERIKVAYENGIFPWYEEGQPILWWSPDPRMILFPGKLNVSKSMKKLFKEKAFRVTYNENFEYIINKCANINREEQDGTWITDAMITSYIGLHEAGIAKSIEVWQDDKIVGGLYGLLLKDKNVFCGESMFTEVDNASKYGFITLVKNMEKNGIRFIDCQVYTKHLESLGAEEVSRHNFLTLLHAEVEN